MSNRRMDRKGERKLDALERNAAWAALDTITKIGRLHQRPGISKRQRDRLMAPTTTRIKKKLAAKAASAALVAS